MIGERHVRVITSVSYHFPRYVHLREKRIVAPYYPLFTRLEQHQIGAGHALLFTPFPLLVNLKATTGNYTHNVLFPLQGSCSPCQAGCIEVDYQRTPCLAGTPARQGTRFLCEVLCTQLEHIYPVILSPSFAILVRFV